MDPRDILQILRDGSADQRRALLDALPDDPLKAAASMLIASENRGMVLVALTPLITKYCFGEDPEIGAALALAAHTLAMELFEDGGHGLLPMTLSGIAASYPRALALLGKSEEIVQFADHWIPYYERMKESQNLPAIKASRIEALVNLNRLDEAEEHLMDSCLRGNPATDIEVRRLEAKLKAIKKDITDVKPTSSGDQISAGMKNIKEGFDKIIETSVDDPVLREQIRKRLKQESSQTFTDPSTPNGFEALRGALDIGEAMLRGKRGASNELVYRKQIRDASGIFIVEQQPAPKTIKRSLQILENALTGVRSNHLTELENDALWGIYLCRSRLHDSSGAADALLNLRKNLELVRSGIKEPRERGGVFGSYPYLFDALCSKLQEAGRIPELLVAIESSKGRGIADILTRKSDGTVRDEAIYEAAGDLPSLTRRFGFHYLSFYLDEQQVYAVLVTKNGKTLALPPVPIQRAKVRALSAYANPQTWGKPLEHDPSTCAPDISIILAPLVAGLKSLLNEGQLQVGDHICYSADDAFNNVPLQYLDFQGQPLAEVFSVSRIHNAFHLRRVLGRKRAKTPHAIWIVRCAFLSGHEESRLASTTRESSQSSESALRAHRGPIFRE